MANEADLIRRVTEPERRIDFLFGHLNVDSPDLAPSPGELGPLVRPLLDGGNKPAAIALVVERTGMGMSEARRTVEQMMGGS